MALEAFQALPQRWCVLRSRAKKVPVWCSTLSGKAPRIGATVATTLCRRKVGPALRQRRVPECYDCATRLLRKLLRCPVRKTPFQLSLLAPRRAA